MAKAFKKNKSNNEPVPVATRVEKVGDTEYGVADYMGRKTYFEKDDNGAFSIPSQDSELNPHFFPGYDAKSGTIDNSNATFKQDMPTRQQGQQMRKAFQAERKFNRSLAKDGNYNIGDDEMARNNLSLNPNEVNLDFLPFANNVMPGDKPYLAGMQDELMATPSYTPEFVQDQIRQQMQGGIPYEQAVANVTGSFTGPINQKTAPVIEKQIFTGQNETILPDGMQVYTDPNTGIKTTYSAGGSSVVNMDTNSAVPNATPKAFSYRTPTTPVLTPEEEAQVQAQAIANGEKTRWDMGTRMSKPRAFRVGKDGKILQRSSAQISNYQ